MRIQRAERQRFWSAVRSGLWAGDAAVAIGVSRSVGEKLMRDFGGVMEPLAEPSGRSLSAVEREEIAILHAQKVSPAEIARRIGRPRCTVSRELTRNSNADGSYRASTRSVAPKTVPGGPNRAGWPATRDCWPRYGFG